MEPEPCQPRPVWQVAGIIAVTLCNLVATVGCFHLIVSILSQKSTRNNTFNLYVVFLIFPDGLTTLLSVILNSYKISTCEQPDLWYWYSANFVRMFYYFSNFYLNCCVAYEIYAMVDGSHRLTRTRAPTMKKMLFQVGCVYSLSLLMALWTILDVPWSFYDVKDRSFGSPVGGADGIWSDGGLFSKLGSMVFVGALSLIPIAFVIGLRLRISMTKLMRNEGRTRTLYLFFERITIVFVAMYVPGIALIFALSKFEEGSVGNYWVGRAIDLIRALQALITLSIVSRKEDIRKAVNRGRRGCFSSGDATDDAKPDRERSDPEGTARTTRANGSGSLRMSIDPFGKSGTTVESIAGAERSEPFATGGLVRTDEECARGDKDDDDDEEEEEEKSPRASSDGGSSAELLLGGGDRDDPATREPPEEPNADDANASTW